jgi:hypothetical protein
MDEFLDRLADAMAQQAEHSLVGGSVRRRIAAIVQEETSAGAADEWQVIRRVMRELSSGELEGNVGDWLRMQVAV